MRLKGVRLLSPSHMKLRFKLKSIWCQCLCFFYYTFLKMTFKQSILMFLFIKETPLSASNVYLICFNFLFSYTSFMNYTL